MIDLNLLLHGTEAESQREIYRVPALAYVVEIQLYYMDKAMGISGGMVDGEYMLALPQQEWQRQRVLYSIANARLHPPKTWRGLDIRRVADKQLALAKTTPSQFVFSAFDICAALDALSPQLTQSTYDFITCADVDNATLDVSLVAESATQLGNYDVDEVNLFYAFRKQMVDEAEPQRHRIATGVYILENPHLKGLDAEISFDTLRLVVTHKGIIVSLCKDNQFVPFIWTPEGLNTSQVYLHARGLMAMEILLSCIWRDCCVVREAWSTRKRKYSWRGSIDQSKPQHKSGVVLMPRTVYHNAWGSDEERQAIERIARRAHTVRASYPKLADGWEAHKAGERAEEYNCPPPPAGHTFRKPHMRGHGVGSDELEQPNTPMKIVCRGLQVASTMLG